MIYQPLKTPKTLTLIFNPKFPYSHNSSINPKIIQFLNKPIRKNPRKRFYWSSRSSVIKKTFIQEQVVFTAPVSDDPKVGIIGGAMAGLHLEGRGIRSNVFDTENISKVTAERVTTQMLQGIEFALGFPERSLKKSSYTKVQLW